MCVCTGGEGGGPLSGDRRPQPGPEGAEAEAAQGGPRVRRLWTAAQGLPGVRVHGALRHLPGQQLRAHQGASRGTLAPGKAKGLGGGGHYQAGR